MINFLFSELQKYGSDFWLFIEKYKINWDNSQFSSLSFFFGVFFSDKFVKSHFYLQILVQYKSEKVESKIIFRVKEQCCKLVYPKNLKFWEVLNA